MSVTTPGLGERDPLCSDEAKASEEAFDVAVRARAADPVVRRVMATLNEVFDGDGYTEDEEGFRWLVVDASRIVSWTEGVAPNLIGFSILDAMYDSGRWGDTCGEPRPIVDALAAAISGATPDRAGAEPHSGRGDKWVNPDAPPFDMDAFTSRAYPPETGSRVGSDG